MDGEPKLAKSRELGLLKIAACNFAGLCSEKGSIAYTGNLP